MLSLCDNNKYFPSWTHAKMKAKIFFQWSSKKLSGIQHTVLMDTMIELMWTTQVQYIILKEIKQEDTHAPR